LENKQILGVINTKEEQNYKQTPLRRLVIFCICILMSWDQLT